MAELEAIKLLHPDTTAATILEYEYYGEFYGKEAIIKAIEAACVLACSELEKKIPKKPIERIKTKYMWDSAQCPVCECGITSIWKYCQNCGQKLEW